MAKTQTDCGNCKVRLVVRFFASDSKNAVVVCKKCDSTDKWPAGK